MSYKVTIHDLPDEILQEILLPLSHENHKTALCVCKRWSTLKLFNLSSVQLRIDTNRVYTKDDQHHHRTLLVSHRRYKHVVVNVDQKFVKYDHLLEVLSYFSRYVETLQLKFKFVSRKVELRFFAEITAFSSNLAYLQIIGEFESDSMMKFAPMNKLEKLDLRSNLLTLIPNMQNITPNITKLHIQIRSPETLKFLRHMSLQLVVLEAWFQSSYNLMNVCTMQFPLLEKLTMSGNLFRESIGDLCQLAMFKPKQLKNLHIKNTTVTVPSELNFEPLENVHMLTLSNVKITDRFMFSNFCRYAFPNLSVLEMLDIGHAVRDKVELYKNMCSELLSLKRLTISEEGPDVQKDVFDLDLGPFLELCATSGLRELRVRCHSVRYSNTADELLPISVEILIMEVWTISLEFLGKLITSMDELRRIEIAFHPRFGVELNPDLSRLQEAFPFCEIILKNEVQIEESL